MPARVRCYLCGGEPSEGRTCADCRRVASESICRSGDGCRSRAGYGVFGQFCEGHAAALAPLAFGRQPLERAKSIPGAKPPPEPPPRPEVTPERVAAVVAERGSATRPEVAGALGVTLDNRRLRVAVREAVERGFISSHGRAGYRPAGEVEQVAKRIAAYVAAAGRPLSRADLRAEFDVPARTLRAAVAQAQAAGLVVAKRGVGYTPAAEPEAKTA